MNRRLPTAAAATLLAGLALSPAPTAAATGVATAHGFAPHLVMVKLDGAPKPRTLRLPSGLGVRAAVRALRSSPSVAYASPDYIATASAAKSASTDNLPNDPGTLGTPAGPPGGWVDKQWNFLPWQGPRLALLPTSPGGINAVGAWENLAKEGHPGAAGITVAVLDTGIAYRFKRPKFARSPDFGKGQFVRGYDFVGNDRLPLDENGHGTHVAGTIAEKTNNGIGLTGLAYRAKLMPVRVLDRHNLGLADQIARGIRFAVAHGADVINMSFNFGCGKKVPAVEEALRIAYRHGVVAVASVGNLGSEGCVAQPATAPYVIGVGGTTGGGCLGIYSLSGTAVDVVAPGGGEPILDCPSILAEPIYQVTLLSHSRRRFGEPENYVGTSMAAAHVSGVAAMILASGTLRPKMRGRARVEAVTRRLRTTARDLGLPETRQGAGLIDAAAATSPGS
jgi:serine protease